MFESKNTVVNGLFNELRPYYEKFWEKFVATKPEECNKKEEYFLELMIDLIKAVGNYTLHTDTLSNIITKSINAGSLCTTCEIIRDSVPHVFETRVILAGGYNIQRLHWRYVVSTNLPHNLVNQSYAEYAEHKKKLNNISKIEYQINLHRENIIWSEENILKKTISMDTLRKDFIAEYPYETSQFCIVQHSKEAYDTWVSSTVLEDDKNNKEWCSHYAKRISDSKKQIKKLEIKLSNI